MRGSSSDLPAGLQAIASRAGGHEPLPPSTEPPRSPEAQRASGLQQRAVRVMPPQERGMLLTPYVLQATSHSPSPSLSSLLWNLSRSCSLSLSLSLSLFFLDPVTQSSPSFSLSQIANSRQVPGLASEQDLADTARKPSLSESFSSAVKSKKGLVLLAWWVFWVLA
eukprot:TRINITY_DN12879_c0_g2_i1.p1 TRINITY_DN12879_c0_g2~~TRINITY_DN12879_c0_g2_i1.p1  ORF type:complete len:177 (+),score=30.71 TRINITY_DN12879_c0_g2_i1:34-531(+)